MGPTIFGENIKKNIFIFCLEEGDDRNEVTLLLVQEHVPFIIDYLF